MKKKADKTIGVIGGMGPLAGIDVVQKIVLQTKAECDQDHLPIIHLSLPASIVDRSAFLLGKANENPSLAIQKMLLSLTDLDVNVVGIACTTVHAEPIFGKLIKYIERERPNTKLLNMVEEVGCYIREIYPKIRKVGVLSTLGTNTVGIYESELGAMGIIAATTGLKAEVHNSIYSKEYGIKSRNILTSKASYLIDSAIKELEGDGAELILMGCTDLAVFSSEFSHTNLPILDSNLILARALIREACPEKLIE